MSERTDHKDFTKTSRRFVLPLAAWLASSFVIGCTPNTDADEKLAPQTGSELTEAQIASAPITVQRGAIGYITADSVRIRTTPESKRDNAAGRLFLNDQIQITDEAVVGKDEFIRIRILQSHSNVSRSQDYYIAQKFVSASRVDADAAAASALLKATAGPRVTDAKPILTNRLYVVINIATDKIRIYQRCASTEGCVNRMIMEANAVNGGSQDDTRTNAGFFQVASWTKFYETPPYPAWWKQGYPPLPKPGDRSGWIDSEHMPNGQGDARGAFGWYTAMVSPRPQGQWVHGTAGWGEDKTKFIDFKDTFWGGIASIFTNIRSHGCTRVDNESIAFIRQLISVGTPIVKIYAREGYRDQSRSQYTKTRGKWEYILTKNGAQVVNRHQLADRDTVMANSDIKDWLDSGTYSFDQYPDAKSGDIYGLRDFHGAFLVDEGTLVDYRHPANIGRGGYTDQVAPPYMLASSSGGHLSAPIALAPLPLPEETEKAAAATEALIAANGGKSLDAPGEATIAQTAITPDIEDNGPAATAMTKVAPAAGETRLLSTPLKAVPPALKEPAAKPVKRDPMDTRYGGIDEN